MLASLFPHRQHTSARVQVFFDDTGWDFGRLLQTFPPQMAEQIGAIPLCIDAPDRIVWRITSNGNFTTKPAWQLVRSRRIGFQLASHCQCCSEIETINHIFTSNRISDQVWQHFGDIFLIPMTSGEGVRQRFQRWRYSGQHVSRGHICTIIPLLIFWFLWTERNDAKHRGVHMVANCIIWRVYRMISFLHMAGLFRVVHWRGDVSLAPFFGISMTHPIPPPPIMDGIASGGGIIRDHTGYRIKAFSASYGTCLILEAELRAILDGILLAKGLGISAIWIEVDSTLAIHCITKGGGPWTIQGILRRIRDFICFDRDTVSQIYREGN
ncbi:uncharacterized protein LOC111375202 [Olea europaea var. sylvestris]|uniref:uncharacterized protein LOC111375202 n=1 Tax=Olea europaea var. sylvestris TaxID=158386 RepID=UPI000C1D40B3|nr:uncharacterized protein LOC111375202 [Olea europaea var. sylvestris]